MKTSLTVSRLWIHPVKGCRAIAIDTAEIDALGLAGDRRFLIIDRHGKGLTQRSHPQMALIATGLDPETLVLQTEKQGRLVVPRHVDEARILRVQVWGDHDLAAEDCGPEASSWVSAALGTSARLVRIGRSYRRPVEANGADHVSFTDAYPLLVITEASLSALNERLVDRREYPVPMERFRPNLVIAGAVPHAEDRWTNLMIGDVALRPTTPCARCTVITVDQATGTRLHEPLRTLATYRRDPANLHHVNFGRNVINTSKRGSISVGQTVIAT